ncbi:MAG: pseudouridine synthase [Bacteroidota bacterium]
MKKSFSGSGKSSRKKNPYSKSKSPSGKNRYFSKYKKEEDSAKDKYSFKSRDYRSDKDDQSRESGHGKQQEGEQNKDRYTGSYRKQDQRGRHFAENRTNRNERQDDPYSKDDQQRPRRRRISEGRDDSYKKSDSFFRKDDERPGRYKEQQRSRKPVFRKKSVFQKSADDGSIRLNKFIAHSGVCSRREADQLIASGAVTVNGKIVSELGTKILPTDVVVYNGQTLTSEKKVYILLNKPKDFITTVDDPQGRKTVLDLVKNACNERVFPVGRLDRNTTGVLLLTNDGSLTKKLTHPSSGVKKLYQVDLDKPISKNDMKTIAEGVELDGEKIQVDDISYTGKSDDKKRVGIELHSGQNRVVRRLFETLGYKVEKLDRITFAGLTKKDLPRGKYRILSENEINFLKMK